MRIYRLSFVFSRLRRVRRTVRRRPRRFLVTSSWRLANGQRHRGRVTVRFEGVSATPECPADALSEGGMQCPDRVPPGGGHALHTGTCARCHDNLTIALVDLGPVPVLSRPIQPADYRATIRVSR